MSTEELLQQRQLIEERISKVKNDMNNLNASTEVLVSASCEFIFLKRTLAQICAMMVTPDDVNCRIQNI